MSLKTFLRITFAFLIIFGAVAQAQAQPVLERLSDLETADMARGPFERADDGVCGNGILEAGEQCDHGLDNGTEGDICRKDCRYDIPEGQEDCVELEYKNCIEKEFNRIEIVEALTETKKADDSGIVQLNPRDDIKVEKPKDKSEACIEEAILECTPEEPEFPETPETPEVPQDDDEPKDQVPSNYGALEGSGCSLNAAATGTSGFGWFYLAGLGLGLIPRKRS